MASDKPGQSSPPDDPASLTDHALERSTETLLGNGARENALERTIPSSDGDGLARTWGDYDDRLRRVPRGVQANGRIHDNKQP